VAKVGDHLVDRLIEGRQALFQGVSVTTCSGTGGELSSSPGARAENDSPAAFFSPMTVNAPRRLAIGHRVIAELDQQAAIPGGGQKFARREQDSIGSRDFRRIRWPPW